MKKQIPQHPNFLSIKQVADCLHITRHSVRKRIMTGKIKAYRIGGLGFIIPKSQFKH